MCLICERAGQPRRHGAFAHDYQRFRIPTRVDVAQRAATRIGMIRLLHYAERNGTMDATVIDTLRFADRLKEAGFEVPQAEGMARALGDELAERMLTRRDLRDALQPIHAKFDAMEARFEGVDSRFDAMESKFEGVDSRFDAMESKFEGVDSRFDAMESKFDGKFDATEVKFDAMDSKFDALDSKIDAVDSKIDSVHRELSGKFNILVGVMVLGFTLLVGLEGYNAVAPRFGQTLMEAPETPQEATGLRDASPSRPPVG